MGEYQCKRCKGPIAYKRGHCSTCKEVKYQEKIDKQIARQTAKYQKTPEYGISAVKKYADGKFWCSTHANCFRATISVDQKTGKWKGESEAHVDKQYERWKHHRILGRIVFCNLRLKEGFGRPDLTVVDNGHIFVEEIICSEKEASIIEKKHKYPWAVQVIRVDK